MHVLDFGCGTATLTIMAKESHPGAILAGIDIDAGILKKATQKIRAKGLDILLFDYEGLNLPFKPNSFARVISCLVFHHLDTATKQKALADIFLLLHKDGQLHIADFGRSKSWFQRMLFNTVRGLDGFKSTHANATGLLPGLMEDAGFKNITVDNRFRTVFGEVQLFSAIKSSL
jgi:ubiquinone/menaquinone biosynthesis C-methylase UbiE